MLILISLQQENEYLRYREMCSLWNLTNVLTKLTMSSSPDLHNAGPMCQQFGADSDQIELLQSDEYEW